MSDSKENLEEAASNYQRIDTLHRLFHSVSGYLSNHEQKLEVQDQKMCEVENRLDRLSKWLERCPELASEVNKIKNTAPGVGSASISPSNSPEETVNS